MWARRSRVAQRLFDVFSGKKGSCFTRSRSSRICHCSHVEWASGSPAVLAALWAHVSLECMSQLASDWPFRCPAYIGRLCGWRMHTAGRCAPLSSSVPHPSK